MKKLSMGQLKVIRNVFAVLGVVVGFVLWLYMPATFKNSNFFHVGSGEYGAKYGALIILIFPLFAFVPKDSGIPEIHTEDADEREALENANKRKLLELQAIRAVALSIVVWALLGLAVLVC